MSLSCGGGVGTEKDNSTKESMIILRTKFSFGTMIMVASNTWLFMQDKNESNNGWLSFV